MNEQTRPRRRRRPTARQGQAGRLPGDRAHRGSPGRARPRPDGRRHGRAEGDDLRALGQATDRQDAPRPGDGGAGRPAGRRQRPADVHRAADPRPRHRPGVLRPVQPQPPRGRHPGRGGRGPAPAGRGQARRHARLDGPHRARAGRRLRRGARRPARRAAWCTSGRRCSAGSRDWCSTASCRTPSTGCAQDVEDKINRLPAQLLRPLAARRAAEPGHQRHRQRQHDAAADDEPADDLAAHGGRRARR